MGGRTFVQGTALRPGHEDHRCGAGWSWTAAVAARRELEESSRKAAGSPEMLRALLPLPGTGLAVVHLPFLQISNVLGQALCRPLLFEDLRDLPCLVCACNDSVALKEREEMWKILWLLL